MGFPNITDTVAAPRAPRPALRQRGGPGEAVDRIVIGVRDRTTGELIRQIPHETALRITQHLDVETAGTPGVLLQDRG